jgi:hypothetical protein
VKNFKTLVWAAEFSLFYNVIILISVTLNLDWVRTRAAGGQFETFPSTVRWLYFLMALTMLYLMPLLWTNRDKNLPPKEAKLARLISYAFFVSTFFQLISKSMDERWNAIPALIIAFAFLRLSKNTAE